MSGTVVFHLSARALDKPFADRVVAYRKIHALFEAAGNRMEERRRDAARAPQSEMVPDALNLVWDGRSPDQGALNLHIAYLAPFCYFDPQGVYGFSSIRDARFDPATVPEAQSEARMRMLRRFFKDKRESRVPQPKTKETFPEGAIAVFLQGYSNVLEPLKYTSEARMLQAVLADTGGRHVIVKPHPNTRDIETFELIATLKGREDVTVTFGNIHDILETCALTVSICSAVSIEGMIHEKPAVLFGRSDFHHCAVTAPTPEDWPAARDAALAGNWPYAAFLTWFFDGQMLNIWRDDLAQQVAAKLTQHGFEPTRYGLPLAD